MLRSCQSDVHPFYGSEKLISAQLVVFLFVVLQCFNLVGNFLHSAISGMLLARIRQTGAAFRLLVQFENC